MMIVSYKLIRKNQVIAWFFFKREEIIGLEDDKLQRLGRSNYRDFAHPRYDKSSYIGSIMITVFVSALRRKKWRRAIVIVLAYFFFAD